MMATMRISTAETTFGTVLKRAFEPVLARTQRRADAQLAEETTVDALSKAYEKWLAEPEYFQSHDITLWSSKAAVWKALDSQRRRQRLRPMCEEEGQTTEQSATARRCATAGFRLRRPAESAQVARDRCLVAELLAKLESPYREVLEGHYYDGLTDTELGDQLFGATSTRQARGLRAWRLRKEAQQRLQALLLLEDEFDPESWGAQNEQSNPRPAKAWRRSA
jgi:DNA-directed RNA polymerase specialized sigma24 family protein